MEIEAKVTVLAEGARGSLSEKIIKEENLAQNCDPQIYGIGLKEIWEIPEEKLTPGSTEHSVGWPTPFNTYAGGFLYTEAPNKIHLGYVLGLNYKNPYLSPYEEF